MRLGVLVAIAAQALLACSGSAEGVPGDEADGAGGAGDGAGGAAGMGGSADDGAGGLGAGGMGLGGGLPDGPPCEVGGVSGVCIDVAYCVGDYAPTPGFCAGPKSIQCCTKKSAKCNAQTVVVPNEMLIEEPGVGGCPAGMLPVD